MLQLSRHLDVRRNGSNIEITNLYFGTHLELTDEEFAQLPDGSRRAEALSRHILVAPDSSTPGWPSQPDLILAIQDYFARERPDRVVPGLDSALQILRATLEMYLHHQEESSQMAEIMFSSIERLLKSEPGSAQGGLSLDLCRKSLGRPLDARQELEQLPCTLYTAQARAEVAARFGGPTLLLGDDDLVSLSVVGPAHVLELDWRIVDFLRSRDISVQLHDLMGGLPPEMLGQYATVIADPPYAARGFTAFMDCARDALPPGGHLVLSTNLSHLEMPVSLESCGFEVVNTEAGFNRYPYPADLRLSCIEKAALYDFPPDLAGQIFGPPLFYADLFVLRRL